MVQATEARRKVWTREELDALPLPPMQPMIRAAQMRIWTEPTLFDHLSIGDDGLWVAMHGDEIVATNPLLENVFQVVNHLPSDEILILHLPPDDVISMY